MPDKINRIAALDVGSVRIGVAMTPPGVSIAQPYGVIQVQDDSIQQIIDLIQTYLISTLVIGLPLGMQGQETEQTQSIRRFTERLKTKISIPIVLQNETLTSVKAEQELISRGKSYDKSEVDSLAACYILEDYINSRLETHNENTF